MLKESSVPRTAYKSGPGSVLLREMGRDEGKDIQRDAVYGNERIPPLANIHQRRRSIPAELGNIVEGEAVEEGCEGADLNGCFNACDMR